MHRLRFSSDIIARLILAWGVCNFCAATAQAQPSPEETEPKILVISLAGPDTADHSTAQFRRALRLSVDQFSIVDVSALDEGEVIRAASGERRTELLRTLGASRGAHAVVALQTDATRIHLVQVVVFHENVAFVRTEIIPVDVSHPDDVALVVSRIIEEADQFGHRLIAEREIQTHELGGGIEQSGWLVFDLREEMQPDPRVVSITKRRPKPALWGGGIFQFGSSFQFDERTLFWRGGGAQFGWKYPNRFNINARVVFAGANNTEDPASSVDANTVQPAIEVAYDWYRSRSLALFGAANLALSMSRVRVEEADSISEKYLWFGGDSNLGVGAQYFPTPTISLMLQGQAGLSFVTREVVQSSNDAEALHTPRYHWTVLAGLQIALAAGNKKIEPRHVR